MNSICEICLTVLLGFGGGDAVEISKDDVYMRFTETRIEYGVNVEHAGLVMSVGVANPMLSMGPEEVDPFAFSVGLRYKHDSGFFAAYRQHNTDPVFSVGVVARFGR